MWEEIFMGLFRKSLIISFKEKSIFRFDYLLGTVFAFFYILFDGSIERFKEEHASQGVSDIEDMVRSIYEEEMAIV